ENPFNPAKNVVWLAVLLATGGPLAASVEFFKKLGAGVPAAACFIELTFLNGRSRVDIPITTLMSYDS
ncbi:MAG: adenine phosphoribosyltransferase, partial [Alphaproteobacteria bacterium]|nr:adenine phosphoribosyltransferase [Alphaproteobacteria bacterium]